jgi:hypothetical protein
VQWAEPVGPVGVGEGKEAEGPAPGVTPVAADGTSVLRRLEVCFSSEDPSNFARRVAVAYRWVTCTFFCCVYAGCHVCLCACLCVMCVSMCVCLSVRVCGWCVVGGLWFVLGIRCVVGCADAGHPPFPQRFFGPSDLLLCSANLRLDLPLSPAAVRLVSFTPAFPPLTHRTRHQAASLLRYNLYVDCMPTDDAPKLDAEQCSRVVGSAINSKALQVGRPCVCQKSCVLLRAHGSLLKG